MILQFTIHELVSTLEQRVTKLWRWKECNFFSISNILPSHSPTPPGTLTVLSKSLVKILSVRRSRRSNYRLPGRNRGLLRRRRPRPWPCSRVRYQASVLRRWEPGCEHDLRIRLVRIFGEWRSSLYSGLCLSVFRRNKYARKFTNLVA